jgi:hypothetical protein
MGVRPRRRRGFLVDESVGHLNATTIVGMKLSPSVFTLVFATSWLGNLVLTGLGFFLAFTHAEPLSIGLLVTVAACILSGNALPIGTYYLFLYGQRTATVAEQAQASVSVREALRRSEVVLSRLGEAEGSIAKSLLLARQLPEKLLHIQSAQEELTAAMAAVDLSLVTDLLQRVEAVEASRGGDDEVQRKLQALGASMEAVHARLEAIDQRLEEAEPVCDPEEEAAGIGERLDLLQESIEAVEHSMDGLLLHLGSGKISPLEAVEGGSPTLSVEASKEVGEEPADRISQGLNATVAEGSTRGLEEEGEVLREEDPIDDDVVEDSALVVLSSETEAADLLAVVGNESEKASPLEDPWEVDDNLDQASLPVPESDHLAATVPAEAGGQAPEVAALDEAVTRPVVARKRGKRTGREDAEAVLENQFEMGFEEPGEQSPPALRSDQVQIRVKSMVGIQNRLYIRGDEPHLSWEAGQRLDVVGIGEFFFELSGVGEGFGAAFWLNDEVEADLGPVRLQPGQRYVFEVRFRR